MRMSQLLQNLLQTPSMRGIFKYVMCCMMFVAPFVSASSSDSWAEFRKDVSRACTAAAKKDLSHVTVTVDPFGSESYGLALVRGKPHRTKVSVSRICVFDKRTQAVELGSELTIK